MNQKRIGISVLFFTFITLFEAFSQQISCKFSNAPAKGKIYIYQYFGTNFNKFDSLTVVNGEAKSKPDKQYPNGFYQIGSTKENSFMLILANENLLIEGDYTNMRSGVFVKNSTENALLMQMLNFNAQLNSFNEKVQTVSEQFASQPEVYNKKIQELQIQYDSVSNANNLFKNEVINGQYKNTYFAKVLKMFNVPNEATKETFFTYSELSDVEYTRGDMLLNKINFYFQKFGNQNRETWQAEAAELPKRFPVGSANRKLAYYNTIQILLQNQVLPPKSLVKSFKHEFGADPQVKAFIETVPKGEPQEGDEAPDIKLANAEGKILPLSSLKGKYVLIDFWASWCGPCRMENPNVVRTYHKFKDKGFTIYSVSLDNNKQNWINAIQKDGLEWPNHVSDLKGWQSDGAALYGVHAIPATFLIDKKGIIIAKNLRGQQLEQKLAELMP